MTKFHYRAVDQEGQSVNGTICATDAQDLETKLNHQSLWLLSCEEASQVVSNIGQSVSGKTERDLVEFATSMSSLLSAGVPLLEALQGVAQQTTNQSFQSVLNAVWKTVESGETLQSAMDRFPTVFSKLVVNLVQAGEESGTLPAIFQDLQQYLEWVERMKGNVRQATMYPLMVMIAVAGLLVLLFTFVIPQFIPVLHSLDISLPLLTAMIFEASEFFVATWWVWLLFIVGLPTGVIFLIKRIPEAAYWMDAVKLRLPVFGELLNMLALSRFTHNFAALSRAGIPVLQCLHLCQGVVGNAVMARAIQETEEAVKEGKTISDSFRRHAVFPPLFLQMVSVGEKSGNLGKTMDNVSAFYNEEIPRRVKKMFAILEPVVTLVLVGVVGTVALSVFLPILSLMGGVR